MALAAVRPATASDAADVARVQLAVWRGPFAEFLPPDVVATLDAVEVATRWQAAITGDGDAVVLVATEGGHLVGFAAGDGNEVVTLLVEPRWGRRGHAGRLLGTLGEHLGATEGITWVAEHDTPSAAFYARHGWRATEDVRTSRHGARVLRERRLTGPLRLPWRT